MLLTLDLGNSHLKGALFNRKTQELITQFRITSPYKISTEELQIKLKNKLIDYTNTKAITSVICASVVPKLEKKLKESIQNAFSCNCHFLSLSMNTQLEFDYPNPEELGKDRISNAIAAKSLYKTPAIIIDSGTTTTFCILGETGKYLGGLITPGITTSLRTLIKTTAQLPKISLKNIPKKLLSKSTIDAMRAGVFYSSVYSIESIIENLKKEYPKLANSLTILTGGNTQILSQTLKSIDIIDHNLTLKGLHILYMQNLKSK